MIRKLEACDVPACVAMVHENWDARTAARFLQEVSHINTPMLWPPCYYVFDCDGEVAGFSGMIRSWQMHNVWDFIWINVSKKHWNKGIGTLLTKYRIEKVRQMDGSAINLMTQNPKFFKQFKFEEINRYKGGWYQMTRQLKKVKM
jgi:GNAT superfamily N-acetyltransferase